MENVIVSKDMTVVVICYDILRNLLYFTGQEWKTQASFQKTGRNKESKVKHFKFCHKKAIKVESITY